MGFSHPGLQWLTDHDDEDVDDDNVNNDDDGGDDDGDDDGEKGKSFPRLVGNNANQLLVYLLECLCLVRLKPSGQNNGHMILPKILY